MEKLALALMVFVLLGSMSTPCDGIAGGVMARRSRVNFGKRLVAKRNQKDLNDGYNEVSRSHYRTFKEKYEATDDNYKANWRKQRKLRWWIRGNRTFGKGL